MSFQRHTIRLGPGESVLPGEYSVLDGAPVDRVPTSDRCPYCETALTEFRTPGALRVATTDKPPRAGVQVVGVHAMPIGLRLLKCDACAQFFSTEAPHGKA